MKTQIKEQLVLAISVTCDYYDSKRTFSIVRMICSIKCKKKHMTFYEFLYRNDNKFVSLKYRKKSSSLCVNKKKKRPFQ